MLFLHGAGNHLCGEPLPECKSKRNLIIVIVVTSSLVALAVLAAVSYIRNDPTRVPSQEEKTAGGGKTMGMIKKEDEPIISSLYKKAAENAKLYFVRNNREKFELQDLLRASAEVLGSGSFGSSYKAVLLNGQAMVVKRFRQMNNVGKEEFREHMKRLGSLSHPNLLSLVAFYHRKEEKLLVSDFVPNGSLASHLHGNIQYTIPSLPFQISYGFEHYKYYNNRSFSKITYLIKKYFSNRSL